jgi:hypothetical protein
MLIPFEDGKLAQEGRAFAPKRSLMNFFVSAATRTGIATHAAVQRKAGRMAIER